MTRALLIAMLISLGNAFRFHRHSVGSGNEAAVRASPTFRMNVPVLIRSHRSQNIKDEGGQVKLTFNSDLWEEWTISEAGNGKVTINSHRGQYLQDNGGKVKLSENAEEWEQWTISSAGNGKVTIKSHRNQYLQDYNGQLKLTGNKDEWEQWSILDVLDGPYNWIRGIAQKGGVHHLEAKTYLIDKQYQLPPNTEIHGAGSSKESGTVIKADGDRSYDAICGANAKNRKGFLLGDNNYIGQLHYIGAETKRFGDNQLLCGGAPFETPGCAGVGEYTEPPEWCGGDLGTGQGAENVTVEDVSIEEFTVQQVFFAPPTKRGAKVSKDITVRNIRCNGTWADGMNFHGAHRNILVEDNDIRNCGDDTYAIWSIRDLADNITFRRNIAVKPRYRPGCWSSWDAWKCKQQNAESFTKQYCFAIYGGKTSALLDNTCIDAKEAVAYGNFQNRLFGGAFNAESRSVVKGMHGTSGYPCYFSRHNSIRRENVICEA